MTDDIIDERLKSQIEIQISSAISEGIRIGNLKGLNAVDIQYLKDGYKNHYAREINKEAREHLHRRGAGQ